MAENHRWYVINTYSGYEAKVKANLEAQARAEGIADKISEILIPSEDVAEMRGGKKRISMAIPTPLETDEVENIIGQMKGTRERPKPKVNFYKDELVKVLDGPFANFSGKVEEVNLERGKVKVMVTIFGRSTPVELDFSQVEKEV